MFILAAIFFSVVAIDAETDKVNREAFTATQG